MVKVFCPCFSKFRQFFVSNVSHHGTKSWYPGHMYKGMLQMQAKLAIVDCILEVHDARIPFSGRNPQFYSRLTAIKPHILILNKCDLIEPSVRSKIREQLLKEHNIKEVMFTDCKASHKGGIDKILPTAIEMVKETDVYVRSNQPHTNLMVIGIPNVGKSSVINRLRNIHLQKKKATAVGNTPGITKTVLEKIKISDNPKMYLYDTPGVMEPCISNVEVGLRLALCKTLKDNLVGETLIADYLLFWLNKNDNFSYLKYLQMKEPSDDIRVIFLHIAKQHSFVTKIRNAEGSVVQVPDIIKCAVYFINGFRDGHFGKLLLDSDHLKRSS
ncbi:hypothetical protein JTE90_010320 [Oedothorax gibbosus]|uniref:Mitochondrial GTPase 1 n=1 Tax=Oedothorax gibbosus TaxID=931172 RepID=A0AAV6V4R2_9ARAC|nr:hypothetical protein JTE90_010320 [Oedothorax gibbosus]